MSTNYDITRRDFAKMTAAVTVWPVGRSEQAAALPRRPRLRRR